MKSAVFGAVVPIVLSAGIAAAATLGGVSGPSLSGGNGSIAACDPDTLTTQYTTVAGNVTAVTVGGLADPACEGGSLSLTVVDATGASIASAGPQTIPADAGTVDNSLVVSVSPNPLAEAPTAVEIVIAGP
jgi:hypothetical protein